MNQPENLDSPAVLLRRLHRWRMAFFGLVILMAGLLLGVAATLLTLRWTDSKLPGGDQRRSPVAIEEQVVPHLRLSREQAERVRPVLRKHMQRLDEIREQGRMQITRELQALDEEMAAVLGPDQQRLWRDLMRGLPGQFSRSPGGRGPGPRGPFGPYGGGQGRARRPVEGPPASPNEPAPQD